MSNIILPDESKLYWAQSQIDNTSTLSGSRLRLYASPLVITPVTDLAALEAVQAVFPGYSSKALENWTDAVIVDGAAMTEADAVTWEATAATAGTLYGVYATNGAGDRLLFVSTFTDPVPIPFNVELQVAIQIDLASIFNS